MGHKITWVRRGGPPQQKPNPNYPDGIDLDIAKGKQPSCKVDLPYPSKEPYVGTLFIECDLCGYRAAVTTAARPDDPRSVTLPCKVITNDNPPRTWF